MNIHQVKLETVKSVFTGGFQTRNEVRELWTKGELKLVKTICPRGAKPRYGFGDPKSTSTYEDCIDIIIEQLGDKQTLRMEIWNGDMLDGRPIDKRATYIFEGEWWKIDKVLEAVDKAFNLHCEHLLREQEDRERQQKIRNIGLGLIEAKFISLATQRGSK